jgi:hypothetical protein
LSAQLMGLSTANSGLLRNQNRQVEAKGKTACK